MPSATTSPRWSKKSARPESAGSRRRRSWPHARRGPRHPLPRVCGPRRRGTRSRVSSKKSRVSFFQPSRSRKNPDLLTLGGRVEFLDSYGLRAIIAVGNSLSALGRRLPIDGMSGAVRRVLEISGVLERYRARTDHSSTGSPPAECPGQRQDREGTRWSQGWRKLVEIPDRWVMERKAGRTKGERQ